MFTIPKFYGRYYISFEYNQTEYSNEDSHVFTFVGYPVYFITRDKMYFIRCAYATQTNIKTPLPRNTQMKFVIYLMRFGNKYNCGMLKDGVMIKNVDVKERELRPASNIGVEIGKSTHQANMSDVQIFGEKIYTGVYVGVCCKYA